MVALVVPMLQQLAKDVQEYIMPSEDWTKCMQYVAGQRKPGQLYSTQAIEVEVLLSEAFDRLELPNKIDEVAWERIQGPCNICGRGNRKEEEGRTRPTTGGKGGTTELTEYTDKSRTELNHALSRR